MSKIWNNLYFIEVVIKVLVVEWFIFICGAVVGSFNNMVIFRLINNIDFLTPKRSICLNCQHPIKWYHNIPILSYILLRGRCANCNNRFSIIYLIVELISATLAVINFAIFGFSLDFLIVSLSIYILLILSFVDFYTKEVPYWLLVLLIFISFGYSKFSFENFFLFVGVIYILNFILTFYIQHIKAYILKDESLKNQTALGDGDIPVFGIIGGINGMIFGIYSIILASLLAIIPSIYYKMSKNEIELPFIPFLNLGFLVIFYYKFLGIV